MIFLTINNDIDSWVVAINDHLMKLVEFSFIGLRFVITTQYFGTKITADKNSSFKIMVS